MGDIIHMEPTKILLASPIKVLTNLKTIIFVIHLKIFLLSHGVLVTDRMFSV
jgi:hypothetical protein